MKEDGPGERPAPSQPPHPAPGEGGGARPAAGLCCCLPGLLPAGQHDSEGGQVGGTQPSRHAQSLAAHFPPPPHRSPVGAGELGKVDSGLRGLVPV